AHCCAHSRCRRNSGIATRRRSCATWRRTPCSPQDQASRLAAAEPWEPAELAPPWRAPAGPAPARTAADQAGWGPAAASVRAAAGLAGVTLNGMRHRAGIGSSAGGSGGSERAIREQLASLWPVTLVEMTLREPHLPASPEHGPFDVYARDETQEVRFDAILQ